MDEKEYTLDDAYFCLKGTVAAPWESNTEKILEKSILGEGFQTLKELPNTYSNRRRKKKKVEAELPEEVQKDLKVLKMRNALDPKRFYKRNAVKGITNNVQVGVVLDSPADFYHSRLPNKMRKKTLVDELLADAKFKKDIKRRYVKIIEEKKDKYKHKYRTSSKRNKNK